MIKLFTFYVNTMYNALSLSLHLHSIVHYVIVMLYVKVTQTEMRHKGEYMFFKSVWHVLSVAMPHPPTVMSDGETPSSLSTLFHPNE